MRYAEWYSVITLTTDAHDDVIKWKLFPRYWPFARGIHRHKGQWRRALMFSLICVWINGWVNNREAEDLRRYRAHYDVIVMSVGPVKRGSIWHAAIVDSNRPTGKVRHRKTAGRDDEYLRHLVIREHCSIPDPLRSHFAKTDATFLPKDSSEQAYVHQTSKEM